MSRVAALRSWLADQGGRLADLAIAAGRPFARRARVTAGIGTTLLVGWFIFTGWWGVDFGWHWDEWYQKAGLTKCIEKMQFPPPDYVYNGVYFMLVVPLLAAHVGYWLPPIVRELSDRTPTLSLDVTSLSSVRALQGEATAWLNSNEYQLEARTLFLCVSALAILWVYLAILRLYPRRYLAALAGAAFLALSWEFQYHARIIAVDAPLAQFLALELLLLCCAWRAATMQRFAGWLMAAAAIGGIVFGCKATGIFALIPVTLLPWLRPDGARWNMKLAFATLAFVMFLGAAFAGSPGMFLDPLRYFETLRFIAWDYNQQAFPGQPYYVANIGEHLGRVSSWFVGAVPAPSLVRSLLAAAVAVIGLHALLRIHRRLIGTWCLFVAALVLFLSTNHLLIVRQYAMIVPFMALSFGAGVATLRFKLRSARVRALLTVAMVATFMLNARWLFAAAHSVRTTTADTIKADVLADLRGDRRRVALSKSVHALIAADIADLYRCEPSRPDDRSKRSFFIHHGDTSHFDANHAYAAERVYSSHEVNLDWYASWVGNHRNERILRFPIGALASLHIQLTDTVDCLPR